MREPWIRVRARLPGAKVAQRLATICRGDAQKAAGVLIDFWSNASDNAVNGFIRDFPDHTLEDWANWKGKRGAFAAWVRSQHMDEDGRVKDWDEYMGALEMRRESDRLRKEAERLRKKSNGRHADNPPDSHRDVRSSSAPTRANEDDDDTGTGTGKTNQNQKSVSSARGPGRDMLLGSLTGIRRTAMAAKLDELAQGYGLPAGVGVPTENQLDAACLDVMATCDLASVSPKVLVKFLSRELRGEPEPTLRNKIRGASGWDNVL